MSPRARRAARAANAPPAVTEEALRGIPLPGPDEGGDKEERGRTLVVGGARSLPGALVLAGTAALRAGAGKLQMATPAAVALQAGVAVPEALVLGLPETAEGGISPRAARSLADYAKRADAMLLGPGMVDEWAIERLMLRLLPEVRETAVVLDAGALAPLARAPHLLRAFGGRAVITPHAGEMASFLGVEKEEVERDPIETARRAANELGAVVVLKGAETTIAEPEGALWRYSEGRVGLATSGSGDVLAGLVAGLLARGALPLVAAAWGVYLHGGAGNALTRRVGPLGFLARELAAEVPPLMARLAK